MNRSEMFNRLHRLNDKLYSNCYGLYDALNRYGDTFDWLKRCRAYERAAYVLEVRLGFRQEV